MPACTTGRWRASHLASVRPRAGCPTRRATLRSAAGVTAADPGGARLLAGSGVPVQRAPLDRLVNRLHELAVLVIRGGSVSRGHRLFQATEVGLDARHVASVLEALALGSDD